jgi:predicted O-methyltransferase YrrM
MSQNESFTELNLGFGLIYYSMARNLRPKLTVCIGSGYGFSFITFAKGVMENRNNGKVILIEKSAVDKWMGCGYWSRPLPVTYALFESYGITNIEFLRMPAQEALEILRSRQQRIDMLFHDSDHSYENVKLDFQSFSQLFNVGWAALFHDAISGLPSGVRRFLKELNDTRPDLNIFLLPYSAGLALVQKNPYR